MKFIPASLRLLAVAGIIATLSPAQSTLEAVVTNKGGFAKDLAAKDFKLTLDGKEQAVTNAVFADKERKQLYLLLFDVATLKTGDQVDIRTSMLAFLDANARPDRLFSVLAYGGSLRQVQGFTSDASLLKAAVEKTLTGVPSANSDWRNFLGAVGGLSQNLAKIQGRKSLLVFTNGQLPLSATDDAAGGMEIDKLSGALNVADIVFHTISPNSSVERSLTSATEGMFIKVATNLASTLVKITDEQDATYTLTYTPSGNLKPGCHKIGLKAGGGTNVKVRGLVCD
jgi:VWFA-related protein